MSSFFDYVNIKKCSTWAYLCASCFEPLYTYNSALHLFNNFANVQYKGKCEAPIKILELLIQRLSSYWELNFFFKFNTAVIINAPGKKLFCLSDVEYRADFVI